MALIKNKIMALKKNYFPLSNYYNACQELADCFVKQYFGDNASDIWWIAKEKGGVLGVNDYFFDMYTMEQFLKYKYSAKDMFAYYEEKLNGDSDKKFVANIKNWRNFKNL